ncbi:MAG: ABC transporter permease subunit [Phycisphaerae bacterium]
MGILNDLGLWFWRLLPANPILVRVVSTGGKRSRHLWTRAAYLIALFVVMLVVGGSLFKTDSLAVLAKQSTQTFLWVSLAQLFLMSFIAPVFTAAAITQEKDANTFHILLTTPLSDGQIVLGSLMSRIYFVWVLLLSGLPIFCITMIFGGVTAAEVFQSLGLAACTGLVTGALAIMISVLHVGTRRTIFAFFVGVAVYIVGLFMIGMSSYGQLPEAPQGPPWGAAQMSAQMSWLAPIHPFLSLLVVTGLTPAPAPADVRHYGWPVSWMMAAPQFAYMWIATLSSVVMIFVSLWFLRSGAREGEWTIWKRMRMFFSRGDSERRRKPRRVWNNPIAWREAATRGSAGGRSAARVAFIVCAFIAGIVLLIAHHASWWGLSPSRPAVTRNWLVGLMWIELAVILVVVTNTAATTLTREKESQTIELLLSTPLTSHYIMAGMLRGLVSFVVPLIAAPTFTLLLFTLGDLVRPGSAVSTPEAFVLTPALLVAFASLAALVGLQFSLVSKKTVQAVMVSTAIVMGAAALLWACGGVFSSAGGNIAAIVLPFAPFLAIESLVDPASLFGTVPPSPAMVLEARVIRGIASIVSTGAFLGIAYSVYVNLVRNFDMTVRRQSA